jgi:hypothetical protein
VPLQLGKIVERVGAVQLAGLDQAHVEFVHLYSVQRFIEQGVLSMEDRSLQRSLAECSARSFVPVRFIGVAQRSLGSDSRCRGVEKWEVRKYGAPAVSQPTPFGTAGSRRSGL